MALTNDDLQAIAGLLLPINNRLDKIESEISALKVGQKELAKEVRKVKDKVNATYDLALETWGQSTENRLWLEDKVEMPS